MTDPRVGGGRVFAYLQLLRPANVVTALADVLAGAAAAYAVAAAGWEGGAVAWLLVATSGLYAGGVVLNDVFDADLDAVERPERPIPSGRASRAGAAALGAALLLVGMGAAWMVGVTAFAVAVVVALLVVLYDAAAKQHAVFGPLVMGACRGGNLLLGVSAVPAALGPLAGLALVPVAYIGAITMVSRGEVHGGSRGTGWAAVGLLAAVAAAVLGLGARADFAVVRAVPFLALWGWRVGPPFVRAARTPRAEPVRAAVRAGVMSLVLLDAALAAGFGGWLVGLLVLALAPLSFALARAFAVT